MDDRNLVGTCGGWTGGGQVDKVCNSDGNAEIATIFCT